MADAPTPSNALFLNPLGTYATGLFDESAAEIPAYDSGTQRLFVVNATGSIDVLDLSDPENPTLIYSIDLVSVVGGTPNSVAVNDGIVAVAVELVDTDDDSQQLPGVVAFFNTDDETAPTEVVNQVTVGALPDMLTFTPDGTKILVANEGEPNDDYTIDPEGSISIIDLADGIENASVSTADFTGFNDQEANLINRGVRIFGPNATVAQDLEPEYIAVSSDSTTAYVALQENNALAVVDIENTEVVDILPLGVKDYSQGLPSLTQYEITDLPVLGTTAGGQEILLGGLSGLFFEGVADNGNLQFITVPDRGPNGEPTDTDGDGANERPFALPDYQARIVRFELNETTGEIENLDDSLLLFRQDGTTPITGRPNIADIDEEPVDLNGNLLSLDEFGADMEGILINPTDGSFWMVDEYRPAIYNFGSNGVLINRFIPEGTAALAGETVGTYGTETLPEEYSNRRRNRGFEAIALDTDENILYAFIQTPLANPNRDASDNSNVIRILGIDPTDGTTVSEYIYLLEDPDARSGGRVDKIGDAIYSGNGKFYVIERDSSVGANAKKFIFEIDLKGATNILDTPFSPLTLEQLSASPEVLSQAGIQAVNKIKVTNLPSIGYQAGDKPEGLALLDDGRLAVLNDNDFGLLDAPLPVDGTVPLNPDPIPVVLGIIDFDTVSNTLDASNEDGEINLQNHPVFGLFQPDAITAFEIDGETYLITANEGDARDYDGFSEEFRVGDDEIDLDDTVFPNETELKEDAELGRLRITNQLGDIDGDGDFDQLFAYGGRSFSIWDRVGNLIFDSGDQLEKIIAEVLPDDFNSTNDENGSFDNRSDDKGPEPEAVTIGVIDGQTYAFIGLERIGGIMVYDVSDPTEPEFTQYINTRDFDGDAEAGTAGDLGPEGIAFISADESPTGVPLIAVANEVSGTTRVFEVLFGPPAELTGFASLPADSFDEDFFPIDSPESGADNGNGEPIDANGRTGPFDGQPIQGFSGVQFADSEGSFWFLSDNGFGAQSNSADYLLRLYKADPDFIGTEDGDGSVEIQDFIQLADPNGLIPFDIVNGDTEDRFLTGADFDIESFVIDNDATLWVGDEFGPFLLHFDGEGTLIEAPIATPNITSLNTLNGQDPLVIGHRGASGSLPEHTLEAYQLAIDQGADFIEPDLVATRDGVLIARHENLLAQVELDENNNIVLDGDGNPTVTQETTNVAEYDGDGDGTPDFIDRLTVKTIDGDVFGGWFSEDFTLAEIKELRARERIPGIRPDNAAFNDLYEIPTLAEIIELVNQVEADTGAQIGIYPETKHPTYFANEGTLLDGTTPINISLGQVLIDTLVSENFTDPDRIFIQSFEFANLIELQETIMPAAGVDIPLVQLYGDITDSFINENGGGFSVPYDVVYNFSGAADADPTIYDGFPVTIDGDSTYADFVSAEVLEYIGDTYAEGAGPWKNNFLLRESIDEPVDGDGDGVAEITTQLTGEVLPFIDEAHDAGLQVHPYTLRNEETFLTLNADGTPQTPEQEFQQLIELGADGFFTDFPLTGAQVRDAITGDFVQAPQNPNLEETELANLSSSRGFEGMAFSPDRSTLYPLLEGSVDGDPDDALRIYEFDVASSSYTGLVGFYGLEEDNHAIGDFTVINEDEFLVIERDGLQGEDAAFKQIFKIDISEIDEDGYVEKELLVDLLQIEDPNDLNGDGDTTFDFPFVTIEDVLVIDEDTLLVANDNNYPFSLGRGPDIDNNEIILLDLDDPLDVDPLIFEAPELPDFTLQILHTSDLEGGVEAITRAPNFAAIVDYLEDQELNSITLSAGDNFLPGPFFSAAADRSIREVLQGVYEELFGLEEGTLSNLRETSGRVDISIMNIIGFDASALGNHEFDSGTDALSDIIGTDIRGETFGDTRWLGAQFPYLSANLDFSDDGNLSDLATDEILDSEEFFPTVTPGTVTEDDLEALGDAPKIAPATILEEGGELIGVVGATTQILETISSPGDTAVIGSGANDMEELAGILQPTIDALINQGLDKIILVSHLQQIALEQELIGLLSGVDVIVAGGSDTLLADDTDTLRAGDIADGDYPIVTTNADGDTALIVSTDGEYSYVGRLVVEFDEAGKIVTDSLDEEVNGAYLTTDEGVEALWGNLDDPFAEGTKGNLVQQLTDAVETVVTEADGNIVGTTDVFLEGRRDFVRTEETNLGNLTADANLAIAQSFDSTVTVSIKNGGGIRSLIGSISADGELLPPEANPLADKEEGEISQLDVDNTLRFNNELVLLTVTVTELKQILEHAVAATEDGATPGQFPQVGGIRFSFDDDQTAIVFDDDGNVVTDGERIQSLAIVDEDGNILDTVVEDGEVVGDGERTIRLVTLNFLADGGDSYPFPQFGEDRVDLVETLTDDGSFTFADPGTEQDALAEYLNDNFSDTAFDEEETDIEDDLRIQNLDFREDTVLDGVIDDGGDDDGDGDDDDGSDADPITFDDDADIFVFNQSESSLVVEFVSNSSTTLVQEVGVFFLDADGTIGGLSAGDTGFSAAALARTQVIQSLLAKTPTGFDQTALERILDFSAGTQLGFVRVNNGTILEAIQDITAVDIAFSTDESVNVTTTTVDEDTLTLNFNSEFTINISSTVTSTLTTTQTTAQTIAAVQNAVGGGIAGLDFSSFNSATSFTATVNREAAFNNEVLFYVADDISGTVDGIAPNTDGSYLTAVLDNLTGLSAFEASNQQSAAFSGSFSAEAYIFPLLVVDGDLADLQDTSSNNDPTVFFPFIGANSDGVQHVSILGENTFGFEDIIGGGDRDYQDVIVSFDFTVG